MAFLWVFLGGGLGASARYGLVQVLSQSASTLGWPLGVFAVNILGCFAMGLCVPMLLKLTAHHTLAPLAPFVLTGFLGGFTTFSTYILDAVDLVQSGAWALAMVYVVGSIIIGSLAVLVGMACTQIFVAA